VRIFSRYSGLALPAPSVFFSPYFPCPPRDDVGKCPILNGKCRLGSSIKVYIFVGLKLKFLKVENIRYAPAVSWG